MQWIGPSAMPILHFAYLGKKSRATIADFGGEEIIWEPTLRCFSFSPRHLRSLPSSKNIGSFPSFSCISKKNANIWEHKLSRQADSGVLIKAATSPGFYSDVASLDFPLSSGSLVSCENFSNNSKVRQSILWTAECLCLFECLFVFNPSPPMQFTVGKLSICVAQARQREFCFRCICIWTPFTFTFYTFPFGNKTNICQ